MKRAILTTIAFLAVSVGMHGQSRINNELLQYNDTKAIVTFDIETQDNNIPSNRKEVIKPFLYNGKDTMWLDAVEVYGKNRLKRERQENRLNGIKNWDLEENQTVKGLVYNYSSETSIKTWMTPANLGIKREIVGCGCIEEQIADQYVTQAQLFFEPPMVTRRIPAQYALAQASRKWNMGSDEYEVIFKVAKTDIDHTIFNNEVTFEKILSAIDKIYSHKDFRVSEIEIAGYASPEGTQSFNKRLGENRAKALIKYIIGQRPQYNLTPDKFKLINGEENWEGLKRMTQASAMSAEEIKKIIEIIDSDKGAGRKAALKSLDGGKLYRKMLKEVYPHLRSAKYLTVYYDSSTDNAVEQINLANSLIESGDYTKALETIAPYANDFRAYNTYGVALMMNKEFEKAMPFFEKAIAEGSEEAKINKATIEAELEWEETKRKEREDYIKRFE